MFKRNPSLTEQVKSHLKQRILNAEFEDGRMPSETDLANELNVSRSTIRDALSRLESEGVIYRKHGAGTFINPTGLQIKIRLEEIWAYETMLEAHGYTPSTQVLTVREETADSHTAADLNLLPGERVLVVKKLFLADEQPVIFTFNAIPAKILLQPYTTNDFHRPMYDFLPTFCRQELAYYFSEIAPLIAPAWLAEKLHLLAKKTALICFEEIGYNQSNEPILQSRSYFRDDLLRLRLIRRRLPSLQNSRVAG